ncbi:LacI family transcriptional regulator [Verrucomicrobia bacterium LW23]|nr:LacI family transcriptional regulator [Verrucomicrobia bacterium LW23]
MPNQREIARILGVHQTTVSLALRGDRSVSAEMTAKVRETAERLGYRPSAYVNALMARIRAGKKPPEMGGIAVVVRERTPAEWHGMESYRICRAGIEERAAELGYRAEVFFVDEGEPASGTAASPGPAGVAGAVGARPAPGRRAADSATGAPYTRVRARDLDRVLQARGIQGVVLAPPYRGNTSLPLRWERYACVGIGHGWEPQQLDRVANDHAQNVLLAFDELARLGRRRIGMVLDPDNATRRGLKWLAGFLEAQYRLPRSRRIPFLPATSSRGQAARLAAFSAWRNTHRPDAILSLTGREQVILDNAGLRTPDDILHACLVRQRNSPLPGVDERNEIIGAAAVELVASQIARNELGIPRHPRLTLIDGRWVEGGGQ